MKLLYAVVVVDRTSSNHYYVTSFWLAGEDFSANQSCWHYSNISYTENVLIGLDLRVNVTNKLSVVSLFYSEIKHTLIGEN